MRVPFVNTGNVKTGDQTLAYLRPAQVDYSGLVQGFNQLAAGLRTSEAEKRATVDQANAYKATGSFADFKYQTDEKLLFAKRETPLDDANVEDRLNSQYDNYAGEFLSNISKIDPKLVPKFEAEIAADRATRYSDHAQFGRDQRTTYYKTDIAKGGNKAKIVVGEKPTTLQEQKDLMDARIKASGLSEEEQRVAMQENAKQLETIAYGKHAEERLTYGSDLRTSIISAAKELGTTPEDLATVISYETGGKFSTSIYGGAGGKYLGLIQFGPAEQLKYGVKKGQTPQEQMKGVVSYLKDRGFKPGMSLMDLYSTINAGSPGKYNASDAANGGAPGTVADKVNNQMGSHKANAAKLLGGNYEPEDNLDEDPAFANVPYEDRVALRKDAQTNVNAMMADQARATKEHYDTFVDNVKTGTYDGTIGRQQLEGMLHNQELEFKDFNAALEIYDKREKEGSDARTGMHMLQAGVPWTADSADDNRIADAVFAKPLQDALRNGDESAQDTLVNFAGQTSLIPPKAIDALSAVVNGQDVNKKMKALDVLTNLEDVANYGYHKVPEELRAQVDRYNVLKSVLPSEELLAAISPGYTLEQRQQKDGLEKIFNTELAKGDKSTIMPGFNKVLEAFDPGMFADQPVDVNYGPAVAGMHSEWTELMKYNFVKTGGNMDAAFKITQKQIERIWGNTDVGGKRKLMAFPVEKFVRPVDGSHAWVDEQIVSDFKLPPGSKYELVADHHTENSIANPKEEVFAATNEMKTKIKENKLSYKVAVEKDGIWTLMPGRYQPEITPKMIENEVRRANVNQDIQRLQELQTQYDNAYEMKANQNIDIPPQLIQEMEELQKKIDGDTEKLKKPVQGPHWQIDMTEKGKATKRGLGTVVPPGKPVIDTQKLFDNVKKALPALAPMPAYSGFFWKGDKRFDNEKAVPEGAVVQDDAGVGWIKKNGKMIEQ